MKHFIPKIGVAIAIAFASAAIPAAATAGAVTRPVTATTESSSYQPFQETSIPNPAANIPPTLGGATVFNCNPTTYATRCTAPLLHAINHARALEGVPAMVLPSNWGALTTAQQIFVVTNLERTARGLAPFVGMLPALNADSMRGATSTYIFDRDPTISFTTPLSNQFTAYGSIWAGGAVNVLEADYEWMYQDGWGSPGAPRLNLDCGSPTTPGCWGHRDNILGGGSGTDDVAGAAYSLITTDGSVFRSYAALFLEPTNPMSGFTFTWAGEVPYLNGAPATAPPLDSLSSSPIVGVAHAATGGYWEASRAGGVFSFGAPFYGSMGGKPLNAPIVGIAATPTGKGYWLVASDGGIFSFGNAVFYGSMGGKPLNKPIVGIASTPTGGGYWEVASDGGIFSFGNAAFHGSMGGKPLNKPVVGMTVDPATGGYWEVASDGGIFSFDAPFHGSMGGKPLNEPVVGMAEDPATGGYWEVASDGGLFSFDTPFLGSMGGKPLNAPVVGMASTTTGGGYWEVATDGGLFTFGNAQFHGSMAA